MLYSVELRDLPSTSSGFDKLRRAAKIQEKCVGAKHYAANVL
jgi:hypothetical protein